jgi:hypothetical protein
MGLLRKGALLSRQRVQDDPELAYIFLSVWPVKAHAWVDYVSLSITRINRELYRRAERNLPDRWWAVLSFDPAIMDDDGVFFATTNNAYEEVCRRAPRLDGFRDLFSAEVSWGHYGSVKRRTDRTPCNQPTDIQAEVLYPGSIPMTYVQRIYVTEAEHRRHIRAWCSAFDITEPSIEIRPEVFR